MEVSDWLERFQRHGEGARDHITERELDQAWHIRQAFTDGVDKETFDGC